MKVVIKMATCEGDKVEVDGVVLNTRSACEELSKAIMDAADIVWPIKPPQLLVITKEKNGAGNNKK